MRMTLYLMPFMPHHILVANEALPPSMTQQALSRTTNPHAALVARPYALVSAL